MPKTVFLASATALMVAAVWPASAAGPIPVPAHAATVGGVLVADDQLQPWWVCGRGPAHKHPMRDCPEDKEGGREESTDGEGQPAGA